MKVGLRFFLIFAFLTNVLLAQVPFTPDSVRLSGFRLRQEMNNASLVKNIEFQSLGPTVMSGRVVDLDVDISDPTHYYVAYASGGLWETIDNGISFKPLFDNQPAITIGDIAVDWKNNVIYVGTGENNSSRSSYSGTGVYKSTDNGKTWSHLGLSETHHIGRVVLHPSDPNTVFVAAVGHLYSANSERGVFKSTDGGATWKKSLFIDDSTGCIDLVINPINPSELYAAAWHRSRTAWNFIESGKSSGIYKSTDGGTSWFLLSTPQSGFPTGAGVGRIGLTLYPKNPSILYAVLDNNDFLPEEPSDLKVTKDLLRKISVDDFLALQEDDLNAYLDKYEFPKKYSAKSIFELVKNSKLKPIQLVEFLEDANAQLFDTPIKEAECYRSDDGGATWKKTHEKPLNDVFYTFGYYFSQIRVSPVNENHVYILGVPVLFSDNGGASFTSLIRENVHVDCHALWINPAKPEHIILGNDGGVNISYNNGASWINANSPAVGQFYTVSFDMAEPYNIYGGLQDNGVWFASSTTTPNRSYLSSGKYPFEELMGGDGMQVAVDFRTNKTVYTGYQFGNYYRINLATEDFGTITPQHDLSQRPFRFNWQTPIHLSSFNQDILYFGSNFLHRSFNNGSEYSVISPDLTHGGKNGDVPYGTLTTIHESPLRFGLIYTGSDDGYIYCTPDGGVSWSRISDQLPQNFWVTRVQASRFDTAVVYASLNGYRWDNFESLIFRSENFGAAWERIGTNLPHEPVNVIKEDPKNKNILYVGTDNGAYISFDRGVTFSPFVKGLPNVPVHDLFVHPRENEIVLATHGRSLYKADVSLLQDITPEQLTSSLTVFKVKDIRFNPGWGEKDYSWQIASQPTLKIPVFTGQKGEAAVSVSTESGIILSSFNAPLDAGFNFVSYNCSVDSSAIEEYRSFLASSESPVPDVKISADGIFYLHPGKYTVTVKFFDKTEQKTFSVVSQKKKKRGEAE